MPIEFRKLPGDSHGLFVVFGYEGGIFKCRHICGSAVIVVVRFEFVAVLRSLLFLIGADTQP